jgi:hypothetical protein
MNALELADFYEPQSSQVAAMLRAQHAAIRQLREAMEDTAQTLVWMQWGDCRKFTQRRLLTVHEAVEKTQAALAATENL